MKNKKILITTDFSDESERAFELKAFGFDLDNLEITLISIFDELLLPSNILVDMPSYQSLMNDAKESAEKRLIELKKKFPENLEVKTKLIAKTSPDTAEEITNFAKENDIDTIVISSHGKGVLSSLFLGSTTQKVISKAKCPVLVIPVK